MTRTNFAENAKYSDTGITNSHSSGEIHLDSIDNFIADYLQYLEYLQLQHPAQLQLRGPGGGGVPQYVRQRVDLPLQVTTR